jgi:hypothetical protein
VARLQKQMKVFLSGVKINPLVKTIQNCGNKWLQHVQQMDRDRQTDTLNYDNANHAGTKSRTNPQKTSRLLMGPERVTRSETLQAMWWW